MKNNKTTDLAVLDDIYQRFRNYTATTINTGSLPENDRNQTFNEVAWQSAAEFNIHGLLVPKSYGGAGFSMQEATAAVQGFAFGCKDNGLVFAIVAQLAAGAFPVYEFGNEYQRTAILPSLASGKKFSCHAITEPNSGSSAFDMEATAERDGNVYVVNGSKFYITNAPQAHHIIVYAKTDDEKGFFGGISAFLVPADLPGISISQPIDKMGLRTCPMANIQFGQVRVPASMMLGKEGAAAMLFTRIMTVEKTLMAASNLGQLERVFQQTVVYCKLRKIGKEPLFKISSVAHQLADIQIAISAAQGLVSAAAAAQDAKSKDAMVKGATAKAFVSERAIAGMRVMQELHGAYGYLTENELEREYRDIFASAFYSGTTAIQKNIIAGSL